MQTLSALTVQLLEGQCNQVQGGVMPPTTVFALAHDPTEILLLYNNYDYTCSLSIIITTMFKPLFMFNNHMI